ncbi:MAG: hypothetical protein JSW26_28110 [Desulfobacterales bacterium]|nr:MAG: hypothetical protein JSW26_28110 [Desulfobacterales bacterium]
MKAICIALVLITGGSLFATGIMASGGCGMKCCCQTGPMGMQPNTERQIRSLMGCCKGVALNPCELQSALPYEPPDVIAASCCGPLQVTFGPAVILSDSFSESRNCGGNFIFQMADQKFKVPPLYLQNRSYLI